MITIDTDSLSFTIPPTCQGQTVEVAYASGEDGIVRRITDRATGAVCHELAAWSDVRGEFEPWNAEPAASAWRRVWSAAAIRDARAQEG
jgi:hypothetical protein